MPLRPARVGRVGVIGHPVAKTAVVAKAVTPGPSPVAKTAVVAAAVTREAGPPTDLAPSVEIRVRTSTAGAGRRVRDERKGNLVAADRTRTAIAAF